MWVNPGKSGGTNTPEFEWETLMQIAPDFPKYRSELTETRQFRWKLHVFREGA